MKQFVKINYTGLSNLEIGDTVRYIAGLQAHHIRAIATVSQNPGSTGCMIRLVSIEEMGQSINLQVGNEIIAGADELYYHF